MKNVITGITDVFKNIGSTFAGFGKNMVEGIWNGISGATRWIKDKISGWVGNVTDFLKDLFGIAIIMIIGIDLGTTNSLAAVWRNGQSELIPNALGKFLTPSVVCVDEDGMVLTGEAARDLQLIKPQNCASNFKRMMGTSKTLKLGDRVCWMRCQRSRFK